MRRKLVYILSLFCISIWVFGQTSNNKPHADSFLIANGDTIWYHSKYTWYDNIDVEWLMNERTHCCALVDSNLNILTDFKYNAFHPFYQGCKCAPAKRGHKWGLVNKNGNEVTDFKYVFPDPRFDKFIKKDFYIFEYRGKKGVLDANGNTIIPFKWKSIFHCHYGILSLTNGRNVYLYYLKTGKMLCIKNNNLITGFNEYGKTVLRDNKSNKFGVIDTSGTIIQPCIYNIEVPEKFLK